MFNPLKAISTYLSDQADERRKRDKALTPSLAERGRLLSETAQDILSHKSPSTPLFSYDGGSGLDNSMNFGTDVYVEAEAAKDRENDPHWNAVNADIQRTWKLYYLGEEKELLHTVALLQENGWGLVGKALYAADHFATNMVCVLDKNRAKGYKAALDAFNAA